MTRQQVSFQRLMWYMHISGTAYITDSRLGGSSVIMYAVESLWMLVDFSIRSAPDSGREQSPTSGLPDRLWEMSNFPDSWSSLAVGVFDAIGQRKRASQLSGVVEVDDGGASLM